VHTITTTITIIH